jgi:hypothetical protein
MFLLRACFNAERVLMRDFGYFVSSKEWLILVREKIKSLHSILSS